MTNFAGRNNYFVCMLFGPAFLLEGLFSGEMAAFQFNHRLQDLVWTLKIAFFANRSPLGSLEWV